VGLTGQQRMLTPPRHLILPLVFPGVCVSLMSLNYSMYLIWALILTADFSVYLAGLTDFVCRLFGSLNLDTLNLTTDIWIRNGAHGGCDRSAGDAHSSAAPDPTFAFVGGPYCPALDFVIASWIRIAFYTLLTLLFCITRNSWRWTLYIMIINYSCEIHFFWEQNNGTFSLFHLHKKPKCIIYYK
jgi:hypothetical protein